MEPTTMLLTQLTSMLANWDHMPMTEFLHKQRLDPATPPAEYPCRNTHDNRVDTEGSDKSISRDAAVAIATEGVMTRAADLHPSIDVYISRVEIARAFLALYTSNAGMYRPLLQKVLSFVFDYLDDMIEQTQSSVCHQCCKYDVYDARLCQAHTFATMKCSGSQCGIVSGQTSHSHDSEDGGVRANHADTAEANGASSETDAGVVLSSPACHLCYTNVDDAVLRAHERTRSTRVQMRALVEEAKAQHARDQAEIAALQQEVTKLAGLLEHQMQLNQSLTRSSKDGLSMHCGDDMATGATREARNSNDNDEDKHTKTNETASRVRRDARFMCQLITQAQNQQTMDYLVNRAAQLENEQTRLTQRAEKLLQLNTLYARQAIELSSRLCVIRDHNIALATDAQLYQRDVLVQHAREESLRHELRTARCLLLTWLNMRPCLSYTPSKMECNAPSMHAWRDKDQRATLPNALSVAPDCPLHVTSIPNKSYTLPTSRSVTPTRRLACFVPNLSLHRTNSNNFLRTNARITNANKTKKDSNVGIADQYGANKEQDERDSLGAAHQGAARLRDMLQRWLSAEQSHRSRSSVSPTASPIAAAVASRTLEHTSRVSLVHEHCNTVSPSETPSKTKMARVNGETMNAKNHKNGGDASAVEHSSERDAEGMCALMERLRIHASVMLAPWQRVDDLDLACADAVDDNQSKYRRRHSSNAEQAGFDQLARGAGSAASAKTPMVVTGTERSSSSNRKICSDTAILYDGNSDRVYTSSNTNEYIVGHNKDDHVYKDDDEEKNTNRTRCWEGGFCQESCTERAVRSMWRHRWAIPRGQGPRVPATLRTGRVVALLDIPCALAESIVYELLCHRYEYFSYLDTAYVRALCALDAKAMQALPAASLLSAAAARSRKPGVRQNGVAVIPSDARSAVTTTTSSPAVGMMSGEKCPESLCFDEFVALFINVVWLGRRDENEDTVATNVMSTRRVVRKKRSSAQQSSNNNTAVSKSREANPRLGAAVASGNNNSKANVGRRLCSDAMLRLTETGLRLSYSLDAVSRDCDAHFLTYAYGLISRGEVSEAVVDVMRHDRKVFLRVCDRVAEEEDRHTKQMVLHAQNSTLCDATKNTTKDASDVRVGSIDAEDELDTKRNEDGNSEDDDDSFHTPEPRTHAVTREHGSINKYQLACILAAMYPCYPLDKIATLVRAASTHHTGMLSPSKTTWVHYKELLPERLLPCDLRSNTHLVSVPTLPVSAVSTLFAQLFFKFICDDAAESMQMLEDAVARSCGRRSRYETVSSMSQAPSLSTVVASATTPVTAPAQSAAAACPLTDSYNHRHDDTVSVSHSSSFTSSSPLANQPKQQKLAQQAVAYTSVLLPPCTDQACPRVTLKSVTIQLYMCSEAMQSLPPLELQAWAPGLRSVLRRWVQETSLASESASSTFTSIAAPVLSEHRQVALIATQSFPSPLLHSTASSHSSSPTSFASQRRERHHTGKASLALQDTVRAQNCDGANGPSDAVSDISFLQYGRTDLHLSDAAGDDEQSQTAPVSSHNTNEASRTIDQTPLPSLVSELMPHLRRHVVARRGVIAHPSTSQQSGEAGNADDDGDDILDRIATCIDSGENSNSCVSDRLTRSIEPAKLRPYEADDVCCVDGAFGDYDSCCCCHATMSKYLDVLWHKYARSRATFLARLLNNHDGPGTHSASDGTEDVEKEVDSCVAKQGTSPANVEQQSGAEADGKNCIASVNSTVMQRASSEEHYRNLVQQLDGGRASRLWCTREVVTQGEYDPHLRTRDALGLHDQMIPSALGLARADSPLSPTIQRAAQEVMARMTGLVKKRETNNATRARVVMATATPLASRAALSSVTLQQPHERNGRSTRRRKTQVSTAGEYDRDRNRSRSTRKAARARRPLGKQ